MDLVEYITTDLGFIMPNLITLLTSTLQLEALRNIQRQESKSYKELHKQKDQMTSLLRRLYTTQHRGLSINTMAATENTHEEYTNDHSYFTQIPSLVEATMVRYNNGNSNIKPINNGGKLDTRTHPDTGLQHPYNEVGDFLCRFPMDF